MHETVHLFESYREIERGRATTDRNCDGADPRDAAGAICCSLSAIPSG